MTEKKLPPFGRCTECGKTPRNPNQINQRCPTGRGKDRCKGTFGSTLNETDWAECSNCATSGMSSGGRCEECDGDGWLFVRDR